MISCKTITHGRVQWLEESLYSFLNQEGDHESEMIIVNDYPLQNLIFDHPKVKIYNLKQIFPTIGDKENFAFSKCEGDIIVQWDDDDIALPNHFNNITKYFKSDTNLLHWERAIFYNDPDITAIAGVGNSGIIFSRNAYEKVKGYPLENAGYDMTYVMKIHKLGNIVNASPPDKEVSWIYRWGGGDYHMSGMGTDHPDRENVIIRNSKHVEERRKKGLIPVGDIILKPSWKRNYSELLSNYLK